MSERLPIVGLIGSIGAGKSAAAAAFAARGGTVIDADAIGHEVLEIIGVREKLRARWGDGTFQPDGRVSRRAIGAIDFADPLERAALEAIVYPEIGRRCREKIRHATGRFAVLDAAVMLEAGWERPDKLVFIDAPRPMRLARVASRGWTEAELAARETAQWPVDRKQALADAVVINNGTLPELQTKVDRLLTEWGWH